MNSKRKGNMWQARFAAWMQKHGFKCMSDGSRSGGGIWKGDIHNSLNMTIEVKAVKRINLQEVWRQVTRDASLAKNMPVVAIHFDDMPPDDYLMVMHSEDWVEHLKGNNATESNYQDPKFKYALQGLVEATKRALKFIPQ